MSQVPALLMPKAHDAEGDYPSLDQQDAERRQREILREELSRATTERQMHDLAFAEWQRLNQRSGGRSKK